MDVMLLLSLAMGGGVSNGGRVEGGWSRPSRPPATEDRFESGGQRSSPERLGDEVIGAELEDADLIVFVALGRQHHDWNFPSGRPGTQLGQDAVAVESGQVEIEDDHIRRKPIDLVQCLNT